MLGRLIKEQSYPIWYLNSGVIFCSFQLFLLAKKKCYYKVLLFLKKGIITTLRRSKYQIKTITTNNGKEFSYHKSIASALDIKYYFANFYASGKED